MDSLLIGVGTAVCGTGFAIVRRVFLQVFEDLGRLLPPLTKLLFAPPDLVCGYAGLYAAAFLMLKDLWLPRRIGVRVNAAAVYLMFAAFGLSVIGLFLPLCGLIRGRG